jgi:uncharacterized secreted protein with C-terminal beta-propeller domain
MSFKNEYKNAIDSVNADGYIKQKVLNKRKLKEKNTVSNIMIARIAAAAVACFAVFVSVLAVNNQPEPQVAEEQTYNSIYKAVKKFKPNIFEKYEYYIDDAEVILEEDAVATDTKGNSAKPGATNGSASKEDKDSFSETTTQVEGVSESDIVKTDGKYIYSLASGEGKLRIIKAGKEPQQVSLITIDTDKFQSYGEMYIYKDRLVIVGNESEFYYNGKTKTLIYDISNPGSPKKLFELEQSGNYNTSRVIGDKLYLISNYSIGIRYIEENKPETYVPYVKCEDYDAAVEPMSIHIVDDCERPDYTVVCSYSITDGNLVSTKSVLGGTYTVYCSTKNIITAGYQNGYEASISRFSIDNGKIELKAQGKIEGSLLNQFSIDEYNGNFRFVTTVSKDVKIEARDNEFEVRNYNALFILNSELKQIGSIKNLAPDERVYSVRFMGDIAYFVTFRQVDPLFSADLSDPQNPKIIGKLKIPGFSNYLYPYGEGLLLGIGQDADEKTGRTGGIKLSMFDISNPANVTEGSKTILQENYSEALYSHKAVIIEKQKDIIGFSVYGNEGSEYHIYGFKNGQFQRKAKIELDRAYGNIRGLYINDEFYIVTENSVVVLNLDNFSKINELKLN